MSDKKVVEYTVAKVGPVTCPTSPAGDHMGSLRQPGPCYFNIMTDLCLLLGVC
jgi:hypothetical protein